MKVAVIPDAAMLFVPLVTKYGHEYLSSTNISQKKLAHKDPYDDNAFDETLPPFTMTGYDALKGNKYTSNQTASGIRGRMSLYDNIIQNSQAAIIMGNPPSSYNHMYDKLNELILFGCVSCNNQQQLLIKFIKEKKIPILEVKYPTTSQDLINIIGRVKNFLENIEKYKDKKILFNEDGLNVDLKPDTQRIKFDEFKEIINKI